MDIDAPQNEQKTTFNMLKNFYINIYISRTKDKTKTSLKCCYKDSISFPLSHIQIAKETIECNEQSEHLLNVIKEKI